MINGVASPCGDTVLDSRGCQVATIVTPDTILRWHRQLIAGKWTYAAKRLGRPGVIKESRQLVVRMAEENPTWGYPPSSCSEERGHRVGRSTIARILKAQGIPPMPARQTSGRRSAGPLEHDCWCGFLHNGGVDVARTGDVLHTLRD